MIILKLTDLGNATGVVIGEEQLAHLGLRKGDSLCLTQAPDGGYRLTRHDPDAVRQMALAETIMDQDREILDALSK